VGGGATLTVSLDAIGGGPEARSARIISAAVMVFLGLVAAWAVVASRHGV
jgi:hypothetical protein